MLRADGLVTKCLLLAHLRQEEIKVGSPEGLRRMYLTNRGQGKYLKLYLYSYCIYLGVIFDSRRTSSYVLLIWILTLIMDRDSENIRGMTVMRIESK